MLKTPTRIQVVKALFVGVLAIASVLTHFKVTVNNTTTKASASPPPQSLRFMPEFVCVGLRKGQDVDRLLRFYRTDRGDRLLWVVFPLAENHKQDCTVHFEGDLGDHARISMVSVLLVS